MSSPRIVLCLFLGFCLSAAAQETRGSLSGIVSDHSGAVVPGVTLQLTNTETGVVLTTTSNEAGVYRFLFLNPGQYKLVAVMNGFKTFERDHIQVSVSEAGTLPVELEIGSQSERVTVSAETPLIDAEKADHGMVIDNKKVIDMPINTRNPIMLAALSNGITPTSGSTLDQKPFSNSADGAWSINGGVGSTVEFLLDGAPNNTIYNGVSTVANVPSVDAVQEFKVMTSTYDAQYGHTGGGAINIQLKSGTNSLHGSAYEYLKRSRFNAAAFSDNAHGSPVPNNALDQYGFTAGGPVRLPKIYNGKDKTFFFFAWEKYHEDQEYPAEKVASVPTAAQRRGDFSDTRDNQGRLITIYDPLTGRADSSGKWIRSPFAGNVIPSVRINPVASKIMALYPLPNTVSAGSPAWQNNFYSANNVADFNFTNLMTRIDHTFGPKERVYARWSWSDFKQVRTANAIPGLGGDHRDGGKLSNGGVIDSVTALSSGMLINLRASLSYWRELIGPPDFGFDATQWGWPSSLVAQLTKRNDLPNISVAEATTLGNSSSNITFEPTTVLSLQPNMVMVRGKHTMKAGLDYRLTCYTQYRPSMDRALLSFDRGFTRADYLNQDALSGSGTASLLLGYAASGSAGFTANPFFQWIYTAPWVQDDIKLTRKLALNLGLRWDITSPVTERFNRLNRDFFADKMNPISDRIDQSKFPGMKVYGGIGFVGENGLPRSPFNSDFNNFQPRIGATYQINSKTVLRAGWGMFYIAPTDSGVTSGFSQATPLVATQDSGRTPFYTISNPFPDGLIPPAGAAAGMSTFLGQGLTFVNPQARNPYVHQFSIGFQRELPGDVSVEASYVGSRTRSAWVSKSVDALSVANLALGDPSKGGDPNYLNQQLPNPFAGLLPGTTINGPTVARRQLLLPFPEFTGVTVRDLNTGKMWYNSLQVSLQKRYSHGLTVTANYTLSKNIEAASYINPQDAEPTRVLTAFDRPQRLAFSPSYDLPFGPERRFLRSSNGIVRRLVGGWQFVVNTVFQSGAPMGDPSNVWVIGDPHLDNPTWDRLFKTGYIDANGEIRNVLPGEQPVFQVRPPNSLQTTPPRWGNLRDRWATTYDASLIKNTRIREGMNCQFRFEAFNALNTPVFSSDPNLTPTSTNFGKIIRDNGQSNAPRSLQFGFRFMFSFRFMFQMERGHTMERRKFIQSAIAGALASAGSQAASAAPSKKMIGIQVGAVSFVDEGVNSVLDTFQESAYINTLFVATFTYGRGIAGRQVPGQPLPDHGKQEYDTNTFKGGSYTRVHPQYYKDTVIQEFRAPDFGNYDVLEAVLPEAKKRGMKTICWFEDVWSPNVPNIAQAQEKRFDGRNANTLCFNNPNYRNWLLGTVEDYARSYEIDGIMWGSERQGAFANAIGASHGGNGGGVARATCFCQFCEAKAKGRGIDPARARAGFQALSGLVEAGRQHKRPVDGYYVTLWRLMLRYPELLAWEMLWTDSLRETYAAMYQKVKSIKPSIGVGWHIWHNNSFSPIYRAEQDLSELHHYSDFLKMVMYHNCAGERMASYIQSVGMNIYGDLPEQELLDFHYRVLDYKAEGSLAQIPHTGFSADYVYREAKRAREALNGTNTQLWPGIDIDIPTGQTHSKSTPESTRDAVAAALRAGADGVLLSRKYSEMKLANLRAAGVAIQEAGLA